MVLGQHAYEGGLKTLVTPLRIVLLSIQNLYYKMHGRKTGDFSTLLDYFWNVDLYLGKMFATKQNKNARSAIFTWLYVVSRKIRNSYSKHIQRINQISTRPTWKTVQLPTQLRIEVDLQKERFRSKFSLKILRRFRCIASFGWNSNGTPWMILIILAFF